MEQQAQDALLQIQAQMQVQQDMMLRQEQQIQMLQEQFQQATLRLQKAEEERSIALRLAGSRGDSLVDSKGVGQPFKFSGKPDQDFAEWVHKFKTLLKAKFGEPVEKVLAWASRQRKVVVRENPTAREVSWSDEFGANADLVDQVDDIEAIVNGLMAYLVSFTTGEANKVVRNAGSDGVEAWRRLSNEFDPTSAMRRVVILSMVQNPPKCQKVEDLGAALEDWLAKKRQYEEYTDGHGNPCRVSDDSLMAGLYKLMPDSLEETVMFKSDEFSTFEALFDRLSSFATVRHSLQLSRRDLSGGFKTKKDPDAMDIGAVSKGKKGQGKDGGKFAGGGKGSPSNKVTCYVCGKAGHKASECRQRSKGQGGAKGDKGGRASGGKGNKRLDLVQCWSCFQYGHYGKDCPRKKGDGKNGVKGKGKGHNSLDNAMQPEKEPELSHLDLSHLDSMDPSGGERDDCGRRIVHNEHGEAFVEISVADAPASVTVLHEKRGELCMNAEVGEADSPDYVVQHGGESWIRMNYDSGAVSTVIPVEMATSQGVSLKRLGDYRVANGEKIPRYGQVRVPCRDEHGNVRGFKATVTHVHKPLGSAGEFSATHDAYLFENGGYLVPKGSGLAQSLKDFLQQSLEKHGSRNVLELYKEGNLYNMYLKQSGAMKQLNALDSASSGSQADPNGRQGHP